MNELYRSAPPMLYVPASDDTREREGGNQARERGRGDQAGERERGDQAREKDKGNQARERRGNPLYIMAATQQRPSRDPGRKSSHGGKFECSLLLPCHLISSQLRVATPNHVELLAW